MLGTETEIQKIERLKVLIEKTREFYGAENEVWCPYFKSKIALTADGFNHLLNKPNRQHRNIDEKLLKLSLLKRGIEVIKLSATVQEYRERFEKVGKASKDGFYNTKKVHYWGFQAMIGTENMRKIVVVVKKIGEGTLSFWSVLPSEKIIELY